MTTSYYADRENLYHLYQRHPSWTQPQLAHALGRSTDWVKKWLKRFREAHTQNTPLPEVFKGLSRARKQPPAKTDPFIVERILEIRAHPPEGLRRTPGPKAIQYYLARDPTLGLFANSIPRSSRTIYRYLKEHGCIQERPVRHHEPMERPPALQCWQLDFKDVSSARADPSDPFPKQQHQVQTYDAVDMGTSILLDAQVRPDLTAETALGCVVQSLQQYGRPASITVDRDTRWVGSPQGSDFPSALHRFCACLGIELKVCDPHHPQQNCFVERYHRTYQEECLDYDKPKTLEQAKEATAAFAQHYNHERPNQALSCGNQPPRVAYATLPTLPALPEMVDPDSWLQSLDGMHLERKVDRHGMIRVDLKSYYVSAALAGQRVSVRLDAATLSLQMYREAQLVRTAPIKGIVGRMLSFDQFIEHMAHQARAQQRLRSLQERRRRTAASASP